jgi:antirestriction protein ArdC
MTVANFVSKKPYSGQNVDILEAAVEACEFSSNFFLTYRQAQENGFQVRKGESGFMITRVVLVEEADKKTGKKRMMKRPKHFTVFNLDQCDKVEA